MGYLDPLQIKQVVANPMNVEDLLAVVPMSGVSDKTKKESYPIIKMDTNPNSDSYNLRMGDCFYFAINKVSNQTRGTSDLLSLADWIDGYDSFLFNSLEKARVLNFYFWDVVLEGKNEKEIKEWLKRQRAPRPGSIRAHNEKVKWEAVVPDLKAADASEEMKIIRSYIAMGAGVPPHWLGGGEGITRATALEMGTPAFKHFKTRQLYVKHMFKFMFDFQIDQAILHKVLPEDVNRSFVIYFPKITERALESLAQAMVSVGTSLTTAVDNEWISKKQAAQVYQGLVKQFGTDLDEGESTDVLEEVKKNKHSKQFETMYKEQLEKLDKLLKEADKKDAE
jgi:hypothetical protein